MARPFIPRDKPKSWVSAVCAGLVGLLIFGPSAALGAALPLEPLYYVGVAGFVLCWSIVAVMGLVFATGLVSGKYKDLAEQVWTDVDYGDA